MSELIRREDVQREIQASFDGGAFRWQDGQDLMDRINALPAASPWNRVEDHLDEIPTIEAVPVKFIDEVIEYLTKCRDYAIHEEVKTAWDEQRQTLIMLLHEWDAWNECGRTGKYGEREEQE